MQLQSIKIANLQTKNNLFLAPLAGYTNAVFRQMCYDLGAGLTFTEMVSAKGLCYDNKGTKELLKVLPEYDGIKAVQLFGAEEEYMHRASQSEAIAPFDLIDINMGCPVPKIYKNGEGSALLNDLHKASKVIKACKSSGKAVTVKFRIGIDLEHLVTEDFATMCEDSGADLITIHGRTRAQIYAGEVYTEEIFKAKNKVKIPVIANGGVFSVAEGEKLLADTGADGIALARSAMYNPFLFAEFSGQTFDRKSKILWQIERTYEEYDSHFATVYLRKMIAFYIKGTRGANEIKLKLFQAQSKQEILDILDTIL